MDEHVGAAVEPGPPHDRDAPRRPGRPRRSRWSPARVVVVLLAAAVVGGVALGGVAAWAALRVGGVGFPGPWEVADGEPLDPDEEIDGVVTFDDLGLQHREGDVDYAQRPPVGGDHAPVWQDCGFYPSAVVEEQAVHSLEHGAVWVTFDPDLPEEQVDRLEQLAADNAYLLVSPVRGLPSPVVASAWGVQLELGSTEDRRLPAFVARYSQGPQTPEPGAPCTGGTSSLPEAPTGA